MTLSQEIILIDQGTRTYDDAITVTDVPQGEFLAVTASTPPTEGESTRLITVDIFPLEQAPGGTRTIHPSVYVRKEGETSVKVSLMRDGNLLAENTTDYPN